MGGLSHRTPVDAVFILAICLKCGWDDVLSDPTSFEARCTNPDATKRPLFIMHGNRDFLMGAALMHACHSELLQDPTVLTFAGQRWLLTHGDALCLDDNP